MNFPTWTKPAVYGAIAGAIILSIGGFSVAGWVTGGTADKMAREMAREEVTKALVPVCLDAAARDPERDAKLKSIQEASGYNRHRVVMESGWATVPGSDEPDLQLARGCVDGLKLDAS